MENVENLPSKANHSVGYSIEFEPEKPKTFAPKCVLEYYAKPALSSDQLQQKLDRAALRRKHEEQARLGRIFARQEAAKKLDQKLRPYIDTLLKEVGDNKQA